MRVHEAPLPNQMLAHRVRDEEVRVRGAAEVRLEPTARLFFDILDGEGCSTYHLATLTNGCFCPSFKARML